MKRVAKTGKPLHVGEDMSQKATILDRWWPGLFCLLFWAVLIMTVTRCKGGEVTVVWDAQADATEFRVWRGIECLATVPTNEATLTLPDEPCALTVTARNEHGESPHSAPLELVALRVQESTNLKTWWYAKTIHREKKPAAFYRLEIIP